MLLYDTELYKAGAEGVIVPFDQKRVYNIGYDLTAEKFCISPGNEPDETAIHPGESVMVQAEETIQLADDMFAQVVIRNSRLRMGLALDAPVYQPGHSTKVYFRVTNMSGDIITLKKGDGIASLMLYRLSGKAERPYQGAFSDETDYRGMADYTSVYSKNMVSIDEKMEGVKNLEKNIYANVLSIMAIFVGVFSLVNINIASLVGGAGMKMLLVLDLTTAGSIGFLIALINTVIPDGKNRKAAWAASGIAFIAALLVQLILK